MGSTGDLVSSGMRRNGSGDAIWGVFDVKPTPADKLQSPWQEHWNSRTRTFRHGESS